VALHAAAPADWKLTRLGDLAEFRNGVNFTARDFGSGLPIINVADFGSRSTPDYASLGEISRDTAVSADSLLREGDIVAVRSNGNRDLIGRTMLVRSPPEVTHSAFTIRIRLHEAGRKEVTPEFLAYLLRGPSLRAALSAQGSGTNISNLNQRILDELPLVIPPLTTQQKIVAILGAYEELIENNRRRIDLVEEIAQRIYREWFVDFRYPGHDDASALEGEQRKTPPAWRCRDLRELGTITMGQSPPSSAYNTEGDGLPFHQGVGTFGEHFPVLTKYSRLGGRIAEPGDVLVSVRAPVGRINVADRRMILGRGLCSVRGDEAPTLFLLYALKHVFQEEDSMGGGSIFNAVTRKDVEGIPILWPGKEIAGSFAEQAGDMNSLIANLTRANSALRDGRQLLLPRLISGQVDVEDLDLSVEEAAA
jgi:type I restriction enzyme, S subunit